MLPPVVRWQSKRQALSPSAATQIRVEALAQQRVKQYEAIAGPFNSIFFGSALGGAAYLAAACAAPFLPEPFIFGFQGGSPTDEVDPHLARARQLADRVLANNPDVQLISHFDPVHDGWLTRYLNHLRIKPRRLPAAYQRLMRERLAPGGTIVHLACEAEWLSYQLGPQHDYQIGGWGGIGPREFLAGSDRIDHFLASTGSSHRGGWTVDGSQPRWTTESEWGSQSEFGRSLQEYANGHGYRYLPVRLRNPLDYSQLTVLAYLGWYRQHGVEPKGTFVGMFNQYAPHRVLAYRLLPLWLVFNTIDSAEFLARMKGALPAVPLAFAALITFSTTPDMVPWSGWQRALDGTDWRSVGARPDRYPQDVVSLWQWPDRLDRLFSARQDAGLPAMTLDILEDCLEQLPDDRPSAELETNHDVAHGTLRS